MHLLKLLNSFFKTFYFKKQKLYFIFILILYSSVAHSFSSNSRYALLIDFETDQILYEKNSKTKIYPASMSKLMTLYVLFDYLDNNIVTLDEKIFISENAWRKGGAVSDSSTMFAEVSSYISIENIIRGIIVHSGNDACIAAAEALSGSEELFADEMNFYANKLGLKNSNFKNSTGLHNKDHFSTAYDMIILAKSIIRDFPHFYYYFSEKDFTWNGIFQPNRNNLLNNLGIDGLKTGKTNESGYSMIVSSKKDNLRLIGIIGGLDTVEKRTTEMRKLINYGQKSFKKYSLFKKSEIIDSIAVWDGNKDKLDLLLSEDIELILNIKAKRKLNIKYIYNEPVFAPVEKNQIMGKLIIFNDDKEIFQSNLISGNNIERKNFFGRTLNKFRYLIN